MNTKIFIHQSAHVSDRAKIGDGTKVWINVQIREDAIIGDYCILSKDVYIDHGVIIGDRCKTIDDDVFVGPNVAFTNDKVPRAFNQEWKVSETSIRQGVSIGANATVLCGIEIGKYAMVAAGSVVTCNVPGHALVMGNPARVVGYVCECGRRFVQGVWQVRCPACLGAE